MYDSIIGGCSLAEHPLLIRNVRYAADQELVNIKCFCLSDQLLSLCLLSFECLNTARSKDLCLASIEEAFFMPLWNALVALFR